MKPTTTILIGAPLSGDEAHVLQVLHADLEGIGALILANFNTPKRQIDFVVITPSYAALLELKDFQRPIFGEQNGVWMYENLQATAHATLVKTHGSKQRTRSLLSVMRC